MKSKKIPLSLTIALLYIFSLFSFSVSANDELGMVGTKDQATGLYYTLDENGDATITDYNDTISPAEVVIPDKIGNCVVKAIGANAFNECKNITSVTITNNVDSIGENAFYSCESLKSVTLNSFVTIGKYCFRNCTALTDINYDNHGGITSIDTGGFQHCTALKSVTFLSSLNPITVGTEGFRDCTSLKNVTIKGGVSLEARSFSGCTNLEKVECVDGGRITKIGTSAFSDLKNLKSINLGKGLEKIGAYAFSECTSLTDITIPGTVSEMDHSVFSGCESLKNVTIEKTNLSPTELRLTSIPELTFSDCTSLKSISIPETFLKIESSAFMGCTSLEEVSLPQTMTEIQDYAFSQCTSLKSIDITDSVSQIGSGAFIYCSSLENINVSNKNIYYKSIDGNLFTADGKNLIQYASGKKAKFYRIPHGVETVGIAALALCGNITQIAVPKTLKTVQPIAFFNTQEIAVQYCGTEEEWKNITFLNIDINEENSETYNTDEVAQAFPGGYTITYNAPYVVVTESENKKTITAECGNVENGTTVILALYNGNKLVEMQHAEYKGEILTFPTTSDYGQVKVFVWDSLTGMKAITSNY